MTPHGDTCFPRHRAAASLKLSLQKTNKIKFVFRFPRHRAAASLKHLEDRGRIGRVAVFRGIGPRPH